VENERHFEAGRQPINGPLEADAVDHPAQPQDVQGYQHDEIAKRIGCSVGNSKSQLHKARKRLRELLKDVRLYTRQRNHKTARHSLTLVAAQ